MTTKIALRPLDPLGAGSTMSRSLMRRNNQTRQIFVAEMRIKLEQTRTLFLRAISDAKVNLYNEERLRAYAAQYTIMEGANDICRLAIRPCGGTSMLKSPPLERLYRDSLCGSLTSRLIAPDAGHAADYGTWEEAVETLAGACCRRIPGFRHIGMMSKYMLNMAENGIKPQISYLRSPHTPISSGPEINKSTQNHRTDATPSRSGQKP